MLAHRLRRWPNIKTPLGQCIVFAGIPLCVTVTVIMVLNVMTNIISTGKSHNRITFPACQVITASGDIKKTLSQVFGTLVNGGWTLD